MGCDIHIITEIRKNGHWEYVKEVPKEFNGRNYSTFSFLADVRNDFDTEGFAPKGLPDDISGRKFRFKSETDEYKKIYAEATMTKVKLPDGTYISHCDDRLERKVSKEEFDEANAGHSRNGEYYIYDPALVNGELVEVPYRELMTEDEFLKESSNYDEHAKDYGYYQVDFDCSDYHSHSYLTLGELHKKDLTDYLSEKCKISKVFYDKFIALGGVIPEGMQIKIERTPSDIIEAIRYAFNPDVLAVWNPSEDEAKEYPVVKGIKALEEIAKQYGIENDEDIRIVFAFDN